MRPSWPGAILCGPAYPVRCHPADTLPIHHAVERAAPGDVLVIDCGGRLAGYIGDVLATACQARGIAGIAIDGGTRDVASLVEMGCPVFSRGISILRSGKHMPGIVGEPIVFAGVPVSHGDIVVGDVDGLVIIPAQQVAAVISAAQERQVHESQIKTALLAGKTTVALYGLPTRR